jgi:HlyD family secretion protein
MNRKTRNTAKGLMLLAFPLLFACSERDVNRLVGTLERDRIELKAESNEPIISRHVVDGQLVQAGDLVLQQDPSKPRARLDRYIAQRVQAAARMAELKRGPRPEAILETEARLAAAVAQTAKARSDLDRARELFNQGLSSQATLDLAESNWKTNSEQEKAIRQSLAAQQHGTTLEELQQAEAVWQAADAEVALAELDLARSELRTPVSGRLDKLLYLVGERPAAGATVAVVLDDKRVFARVYVPEPLRASITPGKELTVLVDGVESGLKGTVRWVSADASFTPYFALTEHDRTRLSYLAEIDLPEAANTLPSGLPLNVPVQGLKNSP